MSRGMEAHLGRSFVHILTLNRSASATEALRDLLKRVTPLARGSRPFHADAVLAAAAAAARAGPVENATMALCRGPEEKLVRCLKAMLRALSTSAGQQSLTLHDEGGRRVAHMLLASLRIKHFVDRLKPWHWQLIFTPARPFRGDSADPDAPPVDAAGPGGDAVAELDDADGNSVLHILCANPAVDVDVLLPALVAFCDALSAHGLGDASVTAPPPTARAPT